MMRHTLDILLVVLVLASRLTLWFDNAEIIFLQFWHQIVVGLKQKKKTSFKVEVDNRSLPKDVENTWQQQPARLGKKD